MDDTRVSLRKSCKLARYAPYSIPASSTTDTLNVTSSTKSVAPSQMSSSPQSSATPYAAQQHQLPMARCPPQLAREETPACASCLHRYLKLQYNIEQIESQQQYLPTAGSAEAGSSRKAKDRVQDACVSMAIMLCSKSLNKALRALHTAYHLCTSPQSDSAGVHAAIDYAEAHLEITIRRLRLAQRLAELQHPAQYQTAAAAAEAAPKSNAADHFNAAAAVEKQSMFVLPVPSSLDATAAATPPVPGGLSARSSFASEAAPVLPLQQSSPYVYLQEEVGSSWE